MDANETAEAHEKDDRTERHPPRISGGGLAIRNFTSQWFLVPQGTGALALVLHQLAYQFRGLAIISQCVWVLTIAMLASMLLLYLVRVALHPRYVANQLRTNIMETACLASISIAYTTVIQMTALNLVQDWGRAWGTVVCILWWINLVMAVSACVGIPYVFVRMEAGGVDSVPVAIRLPPIAALTVAAGGGVVCRYGQLSPDLQVPIIIVSYLCVGGGVSLALVCDAAFLLRLFDQSWPKGMKIFSIMIACGPYGQSSFAMQILGDVVSRGAFAGSGASNFVSTESEQIVGVCSTLLAILLWGYGTFWWAFACIAIVHDAAYHRKELMKWELNLTAWSLVFPWVRFIGLFHPALEGGMLIVTGCLHKRWDRIRIATAVTRFRHLVYRPGGAVAHPVAVQHGGFHYRHYYRQGARTSAGMERALFG